MVINQFESREVCQRGFCARRYDLDMEASSGGAPDGDDAEWSAALGAPEERAREAVEWAALRAAVDPWARPIVECAQLLRRRETSANAGPLLRWVVGGSTGSSKEAPAGSVVAAASGCVVSVPDAREQSLHRDGPKTGLVNAFVPLVPLTVDNGATQLVPRTHRTRRTSRWLSLIHI